MRPRPSEERGGQESALAEFVERVGDTRDGRQVLHLHLSRLQAANRQPHHLRIVVNTIQPLIDACSGQTFSLGNQDIVVALRGASLASLDDVALKVRYLFGNDPLSKDPDETTGLVRLFSLDRDFDGFRAAVADLQREEARRQKLLQSTTVAAGASSGGPAAAGSERFDLRRLAEFVETLSRADLGSFVRRQSVCALLPEGPPEAVFQELYMSIPDLCGQLMPEHNVATDRWLFQHLTQTLDRRMLDLLQRNAETELASHVSINLNISTILSPAFNAFDAALRPAVRSSIVIELQLADIFNDVGTFVFARDYARSRGYRFCLDGLDDQSIGFIDRDHLRMDLVKLIWTPALLGAAETARMDELRRTIQRIGRHRVILCRCGEPAALKFGQSVGIALFQGRQIERMATATGQAKRYAVR